MLPWTFFIENSRHLHNNSLGNGNTNANGWGPGSEIILCIFMILFLVFIMLFFIKACGITVSRLTASISLFLIYISIIIIILYFNFYRYYSSDEHLDSYMITWIVASSIGAIGNILGITLPCCCEKLTFEYELRNSPQPINEEEAEYKNKNNNEKGNPFVEEIYCNSGRVVPESMSQSVVTIDDEQGYENDINIQR